MKRNPALTITTGVQASWGNFLGRSFADHFMLRLMLECQTKKGLNLYKLVLVCFSHKDQPN